MMNRGNMIRLLGLVATIGGVAASLLGDWANEQKMDEMITMKINERIEKANNLMIKDGSEEVEE